MNGKLLSITYDIVDPFGEWIRTQTYFTFYQEEYEKMYQFLLKHSQFIIVAATGTDISNY